MSWGKNTVFRRTWFLVLLGGSLQVPTFHQEKILSFFFIEPKKKKQSNFFTLVSCFIFLRTVFSLEKMMRNSAKFEMKTHMKYIYDKPTSLRLSFRSSGRFLASFRTVPDIFIPIFFPASSKAIGFRVK